MWCWVYNRGSHKAVSVGVYVPHRLLCGLLHSLGTLLLLLVLVCSNIVLLSNNWEAAHASQAALAPARHTSTEAVVQHVATADEHKDS